jgi:tRNA-binding EMAP/Myf-like protein
MRVPLSWLREYVDFDWSRPTSWPSADGARHGGAGDRAHRCRLDSVVVGELLEVSRTRTPTAVADQRDRVGDGEPLEIVCGATNIAAGQRVPVALPGACCPAAADRASPASRRRQPGHALLGDRARPGDDADGILILGAGDEPALGTPLEADSSATPCSTSTSSPTAATPCRWSGWRARSRRSPAAAALAAVDRGSGAVPRFVGALVRRRAERAVAAGCSCGSSRPACGPISRWSTPRTT